MRKSMYSMVMVAVCGLMAVSAFAQDAPSWTDRLTWKGDLRVREEFIDVDGKTDRWRLRLRARLSLSAEVNDQVDVHFRLANGDEDPVSTNSTLGNGYSTKDIRLDRAYFDWHPDVTPGLKFWGGKMPLPFVKVKDLIWDDDLNPEGLALRYEAGDDDFALLANAGVFQTVERSAENDTYQLGAQLAADVDIQAVNLLTGASVYYYDNIMGQELIYDEFEGFGNSVIEEVDPETGETTAMYYENDYNQVELFAIAGFDVGAPAKIYLNYVNNTEVSNDNQGYMAGFSVGKAKEPRSVQFDYNYRDLEADAVVGAFTDSDSGGGGTGVSGHKLQAKYQIAKNWQFVAAYFMNKIDDGNTDYNRLQLDLVAKF